MASEPQHRESETGTSRPGPSTRPWGRQAGRWAVLLLAVIAAWPAGEASPGSVVLPALSPFVAVASMVALRAVGVLVLLAVPVLVLVLWWPRWFCRYACPTGFLQEGVERLRRKPGGGWRRFPFLGRWLVFITLGGALLGYPVFLWLDPLALFHGFFNAWRQPLAWVSLATGLGLPVLLLLDLLWPRLWCQRLCPLGATQELLAWPRRWWRPALRCDDGDVASAVSGGGQGRRYFMAACGAGLGAWLARLAGSRGAAPLRPPGAVAEDRFRGACVRCGNCARACPSRIIHPDVGASGVAGFLTPALRFDGDYCREDCHRCNEVCPSGAIARLSLAEKRRRLIGAARVDLNLCWLAEGRECTSCIKRCPYEAITIQTSADGFSTQPLVDLAKCNGCGACEVACPVSPRRAIRVGPV